MRIVLGLLLALSLIGQARAEDTDPRYRALADAACAYDEYDVANDKHKTRPSDRCIREFRLKPGALSRPHPYESELARLQRRVIPTYAIQFHPEHEVVIILFRQVFGMSKIVLTKQGVISEAFESTRDIVEGRPYQLFLYHKTNLEDAAIRSHWEGMLTRTLGLLCTHRGIACADALAKKEE